MINMLNERLVSPAADVRSTGSLWQIRDNLNRAERFQPNFSSRPGVGELQIAVRGHDMHPGAASHRRSDLPSGCANQGERGAGDQRQENQRQSPGS
jgi:hypothetical protein